MKNKAVVVNGSSRIDGDTSKVIKYLNTTYQFDIVHLKSKNIGHFDYEFNNADDDFIPLMEELINYEVIVFATPVYWYAMSGLLKVFFDRISDLLETHKTLGRKLRGKQIAVLSVSNANDLKTGFTMPFIESANYLGMPYLGAIHAWIEDSIIPNEVNENIDAFALNILKQEKI
tara:strand:+ start:743985 stop:744506 length:522 start_codon:yes stop_codon:yes gene_type:complete